MKLNEVTAIALRIFAICLFLYALHQFVELAGYIDDASPDQLTVPILYFIAIIFVPMVISIIIWMFPLTVVKIFLPKMETQEVRLSDDGSFLAAALAVLGVYVLTYAVPDLAFHITRIYMLARMWKAGHDARLGSEGIADFIATILEIIIAFWLILGRSGLTNVILKIRGR